MKAIEHYENGVLTSICQFVGTGRRWLNFDYYADGLLRYIKQFDAETPSGKYISFWDEDGIQTLKDGTGTVVDYGSYEEYEIGVLHGKTITYGYDYNSYNEPEIRIEGRYQNGKREGIFNTQYLRNNYLKNTTFYINGEEVWSLNYPETPTLDGTWEIVTLGCFEGDNGRDLSLKNADIVLSKLPKPVKELATGEKTVVGFLDTLVLEVDINGKVLHIESYRFRGAYYYSDLYDINILKKLRFYPQKINGVLIPYKVYFEIAFKIEEYQW